MPTGTIVKQQISANTAVIAGLILASQESAIVVFDGFLAKIGDPAPNIVLPQGLRLPQVAFDGQDVPPRFLVEVSIVPESSGGFTNLQPSVAVTGTSEEDCKITITNTNTSLPTQQLLVRVRVGSDVASTDGDHSVVFDLRGAQGVVVNVKS